MVKVSFPCVMAWMDGTGAEEWQAEHWAWPKNNCLPRSSEAESVYRRALQQCGADSRLMFNLGVLLEDLGRTGAALEAYQAAIGEDPNLADCHYNLARLYETLGKPQHAIRHLGQYRRLLTSDSR